MDHRNIAFTKHALERMELRTISQNMIVQTIRDPDKVFPKADGNLKFIRKIEGCKLHVICKSLPEEDKWLVISTWVRGEDDYGNKVKYNKPYKQKPSKLGAIDIVFLFLLLLTFIGIYYLYHLSL